MQSSEEEEQKIKRAWCSGGGGRGNGPSSTFCSWHGVTCGGGGRGNGRVVSLNVTGLRGGELASSIGELFELRVLSIPENIFFGEIPVSLMNLRGLEVLELQGNNFSGNVSLQMSYFESLKLVNLSGNAFSGSIPDGFIFSKNMKIVDLSDNQFSGSIPVNDSVGCDSLRHLKLSHNFLTGEIPPQFGKCRNLRTLLVDGNILEGKMPLEIGLAVELRVLDVSQNSLTGRIPKLLGNCLKLSVLVLTDLFDDRGGSDAGSLLEDKFRGEFNAFVGDIPHAVLSLSSLKILWAPRANLGGRLPVEWTDSSCSLRILNLAENDVTGVVPASLGMCRNLTFLDLSSNNLEGYLVLDQLRVSWEHVVSRVLSATNEEGRVKGENSIEHVTYEEDAIDADDNDERLTKSSNASDKAFEKEFCCNGTVVEDPELGQMPSHETSLDCSIDTGLFVTGSYDHYVNVWDTNTTQVVVNFKIPGKLELRMYKFGFVNCDIASGAFAHTLSGHRDGVMTVEWSASSEWVLITGGRPPILKRSSITKESSTKMRAAQKKFVNGSGSGQLPIGRLSSRGPMKQKLQSSQVKGNGCNQVKQW
ncbi:unnamed protein product [Vicia faba]|uniref:Leucine-rich repeat-containing N-terminal plant-type domain-containing protein n=1 Tax=Vicia faba TaxID=3906 RepID=A0AAV1AAX4_VICFA|nr:unnamed protein product [Vicia faba]